MSRSESNLEDMVSEALLITDDIGHAIIEIEHAEGIITLKGTVESEQDRLIVETLARQQAGVVDVINNLHILDR